jgi:site-specific recombinase XerD
MQRLTALLTPDQMAQALNINHHTLDVLVHNGMIPHTYIQEQETKELRFSPNVISEWLRTKPQLNMQNNNKIDHLRSFYSSAFPETIQTLKTLDNQFSVKRKKKGYNLVKVPNKKYGFLYYVRYIEKGRLVYSRWCTHTNNLAAAEQFAVENRDRILCVYHEKKQPQRNTAGLYIILANYYKINSAYFEEARHRGRTLNPKTLRVFHNFIQNKFIPFLRNNRVSSFDEITPPLISKFQTHLLSMGTKPQTINHQIGSIKAVFAHMVMNGVINDNVFSKITRLKEAQSTELRGCYEIDVISGVFNRKWREELEYLLDLIIYTTDMRNSEIEKIQPKDIIKIKDCYFIDIPQSKTENGVRIVPLHPFALEKITEYVRKRAIPDDGYLFTRRGNRCQSYVYSSAALVLAEKLHAKLGIKLCDVKKYLDEQNITFYSGRYYWKTLMNANGLGDVEEYFMGHRITSDVAKRYNRKDRIGQDMLLKKTREVYRILDEWVFKR